MGARKSALGPVVFVLLLAVIAAAAWFLASGRRPGEQGHPWKITDPVVAAMNHGVALMEQYKYPEAVEVFEKAVQLAPQLIEARLDLAVALLNRSGKEDIERAGKLLDEIIKEAPDNLAALYSRGILHIYAGEADKATPYFEKVVELAPEQSHAWYFLAQSKHHQGKPCRAEYERAVAQNPNLASAYAGLATAANLEGDREAAARYTKKLAELRESPLAEILEMPKYQRVGPLGLVAPVLASPQSRLTSGELKAGSARAVAEASASLILAGLTSDEQAGPAGKVLAACGLGLAMADVNGDGHPDLVTTAVVRQGRRSVALLLGQDDGTFVDATEGSGLAAVRGAVSCALGDYDNDGKVDLFVCCAGPNHLFKNRGDGTFEDVTDSTRTAGGNVVSVSAVFLDADHDADLDIYVCNATSTDGTAAAANQLLNNNADGTFTDIAAEGGVACANQRSVMLAPADLDRDRDTDLVVFNEGGPANVFFNDRLGKYHEAQIADEPIRGDFGGVLQDFNGDGRPDLLLAPGPGYPGRLLLADATGSLKPSPQFDGVLASAATWGEISAARIADVDLDGDLDVAVFGQAGHVLLNDGWGRFVLLPNLWPAATGGETVALDLMELTGDGVPDLLRVVAGEKNRIEVVPTHLTPPANWLAVTPTGDRGTDKRTRTADSAFGTRIELRCGLHGQVMLYTGLGGGLSQSRMPAILGLNGATKADYIFLLWPDGVTQSEIALAGGSHYPIGELERKLASCPVMFAWNGERFEFVTDFAGVGGLGYFVAPGEYAPAQVLEHVKIEPAQLAARGGLYELRLCEPMEEVGYIDRLKLLAVDHPADLQVYPDERLTVTGPPPSHRLVCPAKAVFPVRAFGPNGEDCADRLAKVDRVYAYEPKLDRRFFGFCEPHSLVLDFGDQLAHLPPDRSLYLFINGSIEYPYSQTIYAASQAKVRWEPMKIERQASDGQWETIVPDAGAPGGMGRMITVDLTGKLPAGGNEARAGGCKLRITTNLEIYYDQMFIAADRGTQGLAIKEVPLKQALLRRLGFPLEYSPDGRRPFIYTYDVIEATSSFRLLRGGYTRYGPVDELLAEFDDRYVILGTGDELALSFDAASMPPPGDGQVRSFVLVSHAYCKDMDLYTAECDTVEPLPFGAMSKYPYPPAEHYPDGDATRDYQREFNTRLLD